MFDLIQRLNSKFGLSFSDFESRFTSSAKDDSLIDIASKDKLIMSILNGKYGMSELVKLRNYEVDIAREVFRHLNFKISLGRHTTKAQKVLDDYICSFMEGRLSGDFENIYTYEKHYETAKQIFFRMVHDYGENLTLDENAFFYGGNYKFTELVLSLEQQRQLKIFDYLPYTHSISGLMASFSIQITPTYIKQIGLKQLAGAISRQSIHISSREGICLGDKCYPITGKKRPRIIRLLKEGKRDLPILTAILGQQSSLVQSEIKEINGNFRTKLGVNENLIIHIPTGGYELNQEYFDITFKEEDPL